MADKNKLSVSLLDEEDIPGAKLLKPVEQCGCTVLRRWLLCRGAKTSGKLADLKQRVKSYVDSGLDKKYLRDPDGGVHLLKKKAQAGLLTEKEPTEEKIKSFPSEGYSTDLSRMPKVNFGTIWKFMIDSIEVKKQISTAKPLVKGYNFFMSNHVLSIFHQCKDAKHYIKSQVLPSMKKKMVYTCYIKLSSMGYVLGAKCGCPAGVEGKCNHVCATMFALDSLHTKKTANSTTGKDTSCTSNPCQWSVPPKRKGGVMPVHAMSFKKHDYAKVKKRIKLMDNPGNDGEWSNDRLQNMLNNLRKLEKEEGRVIGWCQILPQEIPAEPTVNAYDNDLLHPISLLESPMSLDGIKMRAEEVKRKLFVTPEEALEIERDTREQSNSKSWYFHRQHRITASKSYRAAVIKESTSPTKAISEILYSKSVSTESMKQGLQMEPQILNRYIEYQHKCGHKDLTVSKAGLVVGKFADGYLGASPDGVVTDPTAVEIKGILEMKFIQTEKEESLEDALLRKHICVKHKDGLQINCSHKYYYQIQQGMYLTETKWADFAVQGSQTKSNIYIERVKHDTVWWAAVKQKLQNFFDSHIVTELAYPRIKYGLPRLNLREH